MRVIICDFTGQLSRTGRRDLESRLTALAGLMPAVDTVEIDVETAGAIPAPPWKRVRVTIRANDRRVARLSEEAPTLTAALELAMSHAAGAREALGGTDRRRAARAPGCGKEGTPCTTGS